MPRTSKKQLNRWVAEDVINESIRDILEQADRQGFDVDTGWLGIRIARKLNGAGFTITNRALTKQELYDKWLAAPEDKPETKTVFVRGSHQTREEQSA